MASHNVSVLILSGILDFPTDRICHHLTELGISFLRINRESLPEIAFTIDPLNASMTCRYEEKIWEVNRELRSVWWRLPTFLRNTPSHGLTPSEQLDRSQWSAMTRGLMLFDEALWMNDPALTYRAESKPYQLRRAAKIGFNVPDTLITNDVLADVPMSIGERIALKSIDTVFLREGECQQFGYTSLVDWEECSDSHFHLIPSTCQKIISPKIDLRVTIVGARLWCDEITSKNGGIEGDWRTQSKEDLIYRPHDLPADIIELCMFLMQDLGLKYGAIDLALSQGVYWFIEINPTGEWGWLDRDQRGIAESIAEELACI